MRAAGLLLIVVGCGFSPSATGDAASGGSSDAPPGDDGGSGSGSGSGSNGSNGEMARRKPITIHAAAVTGTQTDFPIWIDLNDADIAARARTDGTDILFTNANGAALDHEIQRWDPVAPRLQAWVRVPSLAHADLKIYVEYGDLERATAPNPASVFRASFAAVWHLEDTVASNTIADATGTHAGTPMDLPSNAQVGAKLGGGLAFDGGDGQIAFANPLTGNTAHTISAWVEQEQTTHTSSIVCVGTGNTDQARFLYGRYGTGATVGVGQYNDDWQANNDIEGAGWVLVHWVHEGNNKKVHIFRNGVEIAGSPHMFGSAPTTAGTTGLIGNAPSPGFGSANGMAGKLDEVRIATVTRDPSWIATEFANQSSPGTFYAVGPEEVAP